MMTIPMQRLASWICLLCCLTTTTLSHGFLHLRKPPPPPRPQLPRCELGDISKENVIPRGGYRRVDHMKLLGIADSTSAMSKFILQCCQLGPELCQYVWVVDNVCYAVGCLGRSRWCDPVVISSKEINSIYFRMMVSGESSGGGGREGVVEPPSHENVIEGGMGGDAVGSPDGDLDRVLEDSHPVANAGPDVIIQYPTVTTAILDGTQSTDDKGIKYYLWQLTSQDHTDQATLINPTLPILHVVNLTPGLYTFTLTVSDSSLQLDTDEVIVTVVNEAGSSTTSAAATTDESLSDLVNIFLTTEDVDTELPVNSSLDMDVLVNGLEVEELFTRQSNLLKIVVPVLVVLAIILIASAFIVTASFFVCERNKKQMRHLYRYKRLPETIQKT